MGFFKDVDEGKIDDNVTMSGESLDNFDGGMTAEEALAALESELSEDAFGGLEDFDVDGFSGIMDDMENIDNLSSDLLDEFDIESDLEAELASDDVENNIEDTVAETVNEIESLPVEEELATTAVEEVPVEASEDDSKETTVITKGTTIRGGISSDCSLEVMGVITGDVDCQGKLSIYGTVSGNASASEIYVNTPIKLMGDLNSSGSLKIIKGSVVVGTITAASAYIEGAVKGDIEVEGPVIVDTSAVILGNITANSIQINNGSIIEGICTVGKSTGDINAYFE